VSRFELEIWDDETEKVTFYTVRWEGAPKSETDKFFEKHYELEPDATQELMSLIIDTIGTDHGAIDDFFNRHENTVTALPHRGHFTIDEIKFYFPQFPLRLYALRINNREDLVILFNGGIKSGATNEDSGELNMKFIEANDFAKKIERALQEEEIFIDDETRTLKYYNNSSEIIL
jgi:hypothetical protein